MYCSPDQPPQPVLLLVGQDSHGHWLVQQDGGGLEGSFISREAALGFARWEKHAFPAAKIEFAQRPLSSHLHH